MGIYIHGMKLDGRPHKALFTERDGKFVLVVETQYSFSDKEIKVYPVEELPPHGRVIDADACEDYFFEHLSDAGMAGAMNAIDEMPTIIPAEEGELDG